MPLISSATPASSLVVRALRAIRARSLVAPLAVTALFLSASSARADAKQACATAADTGQTARDQGRNHAARESFVACARDVCPKMIAQACSGWLRDLDAATPTIVLGARDDAGLDIADAQITLDGAPLAVRLDGRPIAIDPGAHTLRFEREGTIAVEAHVVAHTAEKNRLVLVVLHAVPAATAVEASGKGETDTRAGTEGSTKSEAASAPHGRSSGARVGIAAGLSLLAIAAGGAAAGAYFVVQSTSASNEAASIRAGIPSDACTRASNATCARLSDDVDAQHRDLLTGELLLAGAGALVLAGAATLIFSPRARHAEATAWAAPSFAPAPGGGTLTVLGTF